MLAALAAMVSVGSAALDFLPVSPPSDLRMIDANDAARRARVDLLAKSVLAGKSLERLLVILRREELQAVKARDGRDLDRVRREIAETLKKMAEIDRVVDGIDQLERHMEGKK